MIKLADTLTPMSNDFYAVESENVGIDIDGTSKSIQQAYEDGDLSGGGSSIQVDTMPIASVDELGKIYEFIGSTGIYVNGYFYECVSDEQNPPTYSWVQKNVQPNSVTLTQEEYEALPEEQKLDGLYYTYDTKRIYKNGVQYGASDAEDIGYNNAGSGIQATTVQGAIDKVVEKVDGLISDTTSSTTSTWSSQKVSDELTEVETELNAKVDKTDIATTIDNTVTDEQIASARAVLRSKSTTRMDESVNPENYEVGAWFAEGHDSIPLSTSYGHPCSEWHIEYVVTGYKASDNNGYKIILAIAMSGNCYIKVQQWDKWTDWIELATMDKVESKYSEENILTSTDWNTLNTKARYYFSGGIPMTNSPEEVPFGLLEVINVDSYCRIQRYFAFDGKLYIRRWSGNNWNEWYRFDGISI